jgi:uncharacterized membrane protein
LPGFSVAVLVTDGNRFAVAVRITVATLVALATRVAVLRGGVIREVVAEGLMILVGVLDAFTSLVGVRVFVNILGLAVGVFVAVGVRVNVCVELRRVGVAVGSCTVYSKIFERALAFIETMFRMLGQNSNSKCRP